LVALSDSKTIAEVVCSRVQNQPRGGNFPPTEERWCLETGSIVLELRTMKLYVGNLSFSTTEETLQAEFGAHGQVEEVAVITDRDTGRPRGFAFVSMNNDNEARAAIEALNGTEIDGRTITVNEARPKSNGGGGGGGGRGGGGGGYRGGGGGGGRSGGGGGGGGGGKRW
jgi:cold-inducible RNA-binding protein